MSWTVSAGVCPASVSMVELAMIAASNLPATIASRYLPVRLIGKGGMGAVYEVEHARTGEHLALKVLLASAGAPAEALERFKREARASARIKSEHVVRVTDADVAPELDGAPFLVMELLEGIDLEQAAAEARPLPTTVVEWLRQVALALDKAHRLGIVHRDLKPENLFLATARSDPRRQDPRLRHRQDGRGRNRGDRLGTRSSARRSTWRPSRRPATPASRPRPIATRSGSSLTGCSSARATTAATS